MTHEPNDSPAETGIAGAFSRCSYCKGFASDVRPVAASDAGSGSGQSTVYACPMHRKLHNLTPLSGE